MLAELVASPGSRQRRFAAKEREFAESAVPRRKLTGRNWRRKSGHSRRKSGNSRNQRSAGLAAKERKFAARERKFAAKERKFAAKERKFAECGFNSRTWLSEGRN